MKIKITCGDVAFDWYEWREVEIDTSLYNFFKICYRGDSWHIRGLFYDKARDRWQERELSLCQVSIGSLIEFLQKVDKPIVEFSNCHAYKDFTKTLIKVLEEVEL